MNVKTSVFYRAKTFVEKSLKQKVVQEHDLKGVEDISLDMLQSFQTIQVYGKEINTLIDIGAHKGLFSQVALEFMPIKKVICIEPNEAMKDVIASRLSGVDLTIHNFPLAEEKKEVQYFLHEDTSMNSIVPADPDILREQFPWDNPDKLQQKTVATQTMDESIQPDSLPAGTRLMVKIDTQGNELNILRSGIATLAKCELCLVEHIFLNPYQTDYEFLDLLQFMDQNGFVCKGPIQIYKRPSHEVSGVDFIFHKK